MLYIDIYILLTWHETSLKTDAWTWKALNGVGVSDHESAIGKKTRLHNFVYHYSQFVYFQTENKLLF